MVKYVKAKEGCKFVITESGFEQPHIKQKYDKNYKYTVNYEHTVPSSWVGNGFVKEVKDE